MYPFPIFLHHSAGPSGPIPGWACAWLALAALSIVWLIGCMVYDEITDRFSALGLGLAPIVIWFGLSLVVGAGALIYAAFHGGLK